MYNVEKCHCLHAAMHLKKKQNKNVDICDLLPINSLDKHDLKYVKLEGISLTAFPVCIKDN